MRRVCGLGAEGQELTKHGVREKSRRKCDTFSIPPSYFLRFSCGQDTVCTCYLYLTPLSDTWQSSSTVAALSVSVRPFVRMFPLWWLNWTCQTACQSFLPSCLERRARSELAIRRGPGIFTIYPHVDLVRVEAELDVRQYRQREETMGHEQGTIPMILADSAIGFLYHHTTSLYSFPLTTAL